MKTKFKVILCGALSALVLPVIGLFEPASAIINSDPDLGRLETKYISKWIECDHNDPIFKSTMANLKTSTDYKNFLKDNNIPYKVTGTVNGTTKKVTLTANLEVYKNFCTVAYGKKDDVKMVPTISGDKLTCPTESWNKIQLKKGNTVQHRYLGFSYTNSGKLIEIPNIYFCNEGLTGAAYNYVYDRNFTKLPWEGNALKNISNQAKGKNMVKPKPQREVGNIPRIKALRSAIDTFQLSQQNAEGKSPIKASGNFTVVHRAKKIRLLDGDLNKASDNTLAKTQLSYYADVRIYPTKLSPGVFNMYYYNKGQSKYWYSVYYMPPKSLPGEEDCEDCGEVEKPKTDIEIINPKFYNTDGYSGFVTAANKDYDYNNDVAKSTADFQPGETLEKLTFRIKNNGEKSFSSNTKVSVEINNKCYLGHVVLEKTLKAKKDGNSLNSRVSPVITVSKFRDCDVPDQTKKKIKLPSTPTSNSTFKAKITLNPDDKTPLNETNKTNNKRTIDLSYSQNASVKITKTTNTFASGSKFQIPAIVKNSLSFKMNSNGTGGYIKSGYATSTYKIKDSTGKVVLSGDYKYGTIEAGTKKKKTITGKLPAGNYKIEVNIQRYTTEDTSSGKPGYTDNQDTFEFSIVEQAPKNVKCKKVKAVKHFANTGITKICLGYAPNYPSTKTEGGQGTYYYVKYVFLPLPIPGYEVEDLDAKGYNQKLTLTEYQDSDVVANPGEDESNLTNQAKLKLFYRDFSENKQNFLNYPSHKEQNSGLAGPYTVGPHEYLHFAYRGRLFAESADFTFEVKDPKNKTLASGKISYTLPTNCYSNTMLDYKDECRSVFFYLPNEKENSTSIEDYQSEPEDRYKVHFRNPGVHSFNFEAKEKQIYRYQVDEGHERQGKKGNKMDTGMSPPYDVPKSQTHINGVYKPLETLKNRCYLEYDAYGAEKGKYCFHNHNQDFHYWRYKYSTIKTYTGNFKAEIKD